MWLRGRGMNDIQPRFYYGWVIVLALSLTQVTSWGVLYYGFGVLLPAMEADLGWSRATLTGGFSLALLLSALVAAPFGRWVDQHGTRALMTAGSVVATLVLLGWSQVSSVTGYYLIFAGLGIAMAAVLYDPAFAAVAVWFRVQRTRALAVLTFFGGLASLVFIPLTSWLVQTQDWRTALLILAAIVGCLTILPHALFLRRQPEDLGLVPDGAPVPANLPIIEPGISVAQALHTRSFWLLAVAFSSTTFVTLVLNVHLVSYLIEARFSPTLAATAAGLHGLMSVSGRLTLAPLAGRIGLVTLLALLMVCEVVAIVVLLLLPGEFGVFGYVILFGIGAGAATPVRAALIAARYGRAAYGAINGMLTLVSTPARFLAPVGAGWLSTMIGYRPLLWGLVGSLALALACLLGAQRQAGQQARRS